MQAKCTRLRQCMERAKEEERGSKQTGGREGGREVEHDGPCDTGSATAGCYVSTPPALCPHRLSRLCVSPIPHPVAAAHFFFPATHMAPHMAASLSLTSSITLPPPLSLTRLHPLTSPGSHQPLLPVLSLSLSVYSSPIIFINRSLNAVQ